MTNVNIVHNDPIAVSTKENCRSFTDKRGGVMSLFVFPTSVFVLRMGFATRTKAETKGIDVIFVGILLPLWRSSLFFRMPRAKVFRYCIRVRMVFLLRIDLTLSEEL